MAESKWFSEKEVMWPGQRFCLEIEKELYHERSEYQDILVFNSTHYGKVLVLDGVIQLTERDEHAYQEMMAHVAMFAHENPEKVLIVGGGDGGVLREVCRHSCVKTIDMCEIDPAVCRIAKEFELSTATSFDDPRLNLVHEDAAEFVLRDEAGPYDIIIVDSSDPVGPAESLYKPGFYESMKAVLKRGGIIACQGECMWLHLPLITTVMHACVDIFEAVDYCYTTVPTYPSGQIGIILGSNVPRNLSEPVRDPGPMAGSLRYYSPEVHSAAFVLPAFAEKEIAQGRRREEEDTSRSCTIS
jgi:spermidine synthase